MTTPIYDSTKAAFDLMKQTARIEARREIAEELKAIPKPTKQIKDLIVKFEHGKE